MSDGASAIGVLDSVDTDVSSVDTGTVTTDTSPSTDSAVGGESTEVLDVVGEETGGEESPDAELVSEESNAEGEPEQREAITESQDKSVAEVNKHLAQYTEAFQTPEEARNVAGWLKENGGDFQTVQTMVTEMKALDDLMFKASEGDNAANLVKQAVAALDKAGVTGRTLPRIAAEFASAVRNMDENAYHQEVTYPETAHVIKSAGLADALNAIYQHFQRGDAQNALRVLYATHQWCTGLESYANGKAREARELTQVQREKAELESTKAFNEHSAVVDQADKDLRTALKTELKPFLNSTYFRQLSKPVQEHAIEQVVASLRKEMAADKNLRTTLKTYSDKLLSAKTQAEKDEAKTKILTANKSFVDAFVRSGQPKEILQSLHSALRDPNSISTRTEVQPQQVTEKPAAKSSSGAQFLPTKPANLIRQGGLIKAGKRVLDVEDLRTLEVSGRGYVKDPRVKGGVKLVTWRKK